MNNKFKKLMLIDAWWEFIYGFIGPFLTIYFNNFGTLEDVGYGVAILFFVQGITSYFASKVLNKNNAKTILLFSQIGEALRAFAFLGVVNVMQVYIIQFIGGITKGFIDPAYNEIFVMVSKKEKGESFGKRSSLFNFAIALSALLSGMLINRFGYTVVFLSWGIMEFIYGAYVYRNI